MTEKEVQKLNRKQLLEFLLEAQTENEALHQERAELRKQIKALQEQLKLARSGADDAGRQATALLQEARAAADNVAESQREQKAAQDQHLQEWELRLKQWEDRIREKETALKSGEAELRNKRDAILKEAETAASELKRRAEKSADDAMRKASSNAVAIIQRAEAAAVAREQKAAEDAERILQHAQENSSLFWEDVTDNLKKLFKNSGGSDE